MLDRRTFIAAASAMTSAIATPAFSAAANPLVGTTLGRVSGHREGSVNVFRGLRYGVADRFRLPAAPAPSRDIIDAYRFGPSAPQRNDKYKPQSEDCLLLNIWTPEARRGANLPVMVYIHGGAYSTGSVVDPLNDGRHLASSGMVVVTVNDRL